MKSSNSASVVRMAELKQLIQVSILSNRPLLISGAPGIGKSAAAEQARQEMDMDLILSHPVVSDPTDAKGFPCQFVDPNTNETFADFLPYGDLRTAMEATRPTLWMLDDLGQAPAATQASYMQLLLAREVNGKKISPHIRFIAATNRRQDRAGVTGILEPVKSRFGMLVELQAHIDDFTEWAYPAGILPSIIAYLRFDTAKLHDFTPSNDMQASPCPRTWHMVSDNLKAAAAVPMASKTRKKIVSSGVGESAAAGYLTFERIYQDLPDIDNIISYPDMFMGNLAPDCMFAVCSSVATRVTLENFANIVKLTSRMPIEFSKMLIDDCKRIAPEIVSTEAYVDWSCANVDLVRD